MIMAMKTVSIQDLKARLSAIVAQAEAGDTIVITRHHAPVAQVSPARMPDVHGGGRIALERPVDPRKSEEPGATRARRRVTRGTVSAVHRPRGAGCQSLRP